MESGRTLDNYSVGGNTNARVIEEAQPEKKAVITSGRGEGQKYKKGHNTRQKRASGLI